MTDRKDPPTSIIKEFLTRIGHPDGGSIRTDQGGELARSTLFTEMIKEFHYSIEPTGADSPSQNGAVEIYNDKLGVRVRTLLYGSGLPATFWSSALQHSVYLHNRLVHSVTKRTPIEGYFGFRPDVGHLKTFSRVCVKRSGKRNAKLDKNNFTGIFIGYTATDNNIEYLDLTTGTVKRSHHAQFDEAWYLQPTRPPAAQLLYDLRIEPDDATYSGTGRYSETAYNDIRLPGTVEPIKVPWPPLAPGFHSAKKQWCLPPGCSKLHLPLRISPGVSDPIDSASRPPVARAALLQSQTGRQAPRKRRAIDISTDFGVSGSDMRTVYMSPDPYHDSFEQPLDLRKFHMASHPLAGLDLYESNHRVHLNSLTAVVTDLRPLFF